MYHALRFYFRWRGFVAWQFSQPTINAIPWQLDTPKNSIRFYHSLSTINWVTYRDSWDFFWQRCSMVHYGKNVVLRFRYASIFLFIFIFCSHSVCRTMHTDNVLRTQWRRWWRLWVFPFGTHPFRARLLNERRRRRHCCRRPKQLQDKCKKTKNSLLMIMLIL